MRMSGSVPLARRSSQVSAALGLVFASGLSRKNFTPSSVSMRKMGIPAKAVSLIASFLARVMAEFLSSSGMCRSMRPY